MRTTLYIRAAKYDDQLIVKASSSVNHESITKRADNTTYVLPTINFAIELNLEAVMFEEAERIIARINVNAEEVETCDVVRVLNP